MPVIEIKTIIPAPVEHCFNAARNLDVLMRFLKWFRVQLVGAKRHGLFEPGENLEFQIDLVLFKLSFTSHLSAFDPPTLFTDVHDLFFLKRSSHTHRFEPQNGDTVMTDHYDYELHGGQWLNALLAPLLGLLIVINFRIKNQILKQHALTGFD